MNEPVTTTIASSENACDCAACERARNIADPELMGQFPLGCTHLVGEGEARTLCGHRFERFDVPVGCGGALSSAGVCAADDCMIEDDVCDQYAGDAVDNVNCLACIRMVNAARRLLELPAHAGLLRPQEEKRRRQTWRLELRARRVRPDDWWTGYFNG